MDVRKAVEEAQGAITLLQSRLTAIETRRNETLAHADSRPMGDPEGYMTAGRISYQRIESLFDEAADILDNFSRLYYGKLIPLKDPDLNDCHRAIALLGNGAAK